MKFIKTHLHSATTHEQIKRCLWSQITDDDKDHLACRRETLMSKQTRRQFGHQIIRPT